MDFEDINEQFWSLGAEIFVPAAASRLVSKTQLQQLIDHDLEVISCGANVPFNDPEIFFGPTGELADARVSVIPDFIANCGMARVFAYLMSESIEITDEAIFADTSATIRKALQKTHNINPTQIHIARTSFEIALNQLI